MKIGLVVNQPALGGAERQAVGTSSSRSKS
jgi:hypothetical protein